MDDKIVVSKKREINWLRVLFQLEVNTSAIFTVGYVIKYGCLWKTAFFALALTVLGVLGEFAGAHRLWAHASYKANTGLRIFLMLCQTLVGHGTIYEWVQWHRLHHKHFGTDLDPYNPKKGFLYSHFFCLLRDLSPAQLEALKEIDMSDLEGDKVIMFQKNWYNFIFPIVGVLLPINAPCEYWGEAIVTSFMVVGWFKYALTLHLCWLLHSAMNIWDLKPGEKFPADTNLVFLITKTYWISYHYLTPWDYQTSEYGKYGSDWITKFIKVCAALDCASELKTVDGPSVRKALAKSLTENRRVDECLAECAGIEGYTKGHGVAQKVCCS
ncbi:acyl-CoA Delta-9 desaturase [Anthonomus grandis grandis]|uniref:acyl-CoA Delta-9 desaturase n=1 Tax=Anthonomus grandis grandis TaxID=2921223 RepID=UPI00216666A9|nr:acyl-CoA Delta-9 desaturase [Anthonomus grandis grandis]